MTINENVTSEMNRLIHQIKENQSSDGTWKYCFESGPMTDAYMLMLLRILKYNDEELIKKLYNRLIHTQQANGAWKLYDDDGGWGAFERNHYKTFIGLFPIDNFKDTAIDPSTFLYESLT